MRDGFMSEMFSQDFVTTYKHLSPTPLFFFPINSNYPRGGHVCGCHGEMGARSFMLRFIGKNYLVLVPLL